MNKTFTEQLSESLGKAQAPEFQAAYKALREIADGIQQVVSNGKSGQLEVSLEPGHVTNIGQQFRLRLRVPARKWEETLLRAYVPSGGFPVKLDLGKEDLVPTGNATELQQTVLDFLKTPEIDSRLTSVRELL